MERRLSILVCRVQAGPRPEQQPDRLQAAPVRGKVKRGAAPRVRLVHQDADRQQAGQAGAVALAGELVDGAERGVLVCVGVRLRWWGREGV